jgi:alkylated DNA nucleotide flippase Atl1
MSGLAIVAVTAGASDNAYRIFESLNNTGLKLTQADLLRNYLFMRLPTRGDGVYQSLWLPLQQSLTPEQLETLFWLDVVQRDPRVKQTEIYAEQQRRLDRLSTEEEIEAEIARFNKLGTLLTLILQPSSEADPEVRLRLTRLGEWGSTTAYPILLYLLELRDQGEVSSAQIARAMLYLESFFVRRLIIGRATANLNRILSAVITELDETKPVDEAIRVGLSTGRTYYATDDEIKNAVAAVPFYLNGRANQRKLVLQWLEESYGSKEPVSPGKLTIEHVLPQTPTRDWRNMLAEDIATGQTFDQVHQAIVHTLGNLTLTGYNPALSNSPFGEKNELLARSGLVMNREIANEVRWGTPEILARAAQLAERIIRIWPGPADAVEPVDTAWDVAIRALAQIPAGAWTTYGDIAALIGSHPIAVGTRLATQPAPNAHRVLQANGRVADNFRWLEPGRPDDPRSILEAEGVIFDDHGRADPQQRLNVEDLAQLAGVTTEEPPESLPEPPADNDYLSRFERILAASQTTVTIEGIDTAVTAWVSIGGSIWWGRGNETSCFLVARKDDHRLGNIWPVVLYPSGKCEVVFQHMSARPPFDDVQLREEFRQKLNKIPGVDLPSSKLELRPGFPLSVLADEEARNLFLDALGWFYLQASDPGA